MTADFVALTAGIAGLAMGAAITVTTVLLDFSGTTGKAIGDIDVQGVSGSASSLPTGGNGTGQGSSEQN